MQTFLFTDIEGSTRLWERHPQAMGAAIARHERILREAIGVRGGAVFNTAGDSVCAVFPSTDRAIAAAIDAQRHLLAEPWDTYAPDLTLSVRMALDAGDAEASGENFVGPVLNRLHRLMKTGHGGQILCTAAIARDDLGSDLRLRDLGRHPLRDIAEETQLYQLVAPGLSVVFPPLITERPLLRRLPLPPAALFGRDQQIEHIDALLRQQQTRLVTLLGPGGVGKTSLALALGRQFVDTVADGVVFVDLSAVRDGALVVPTIAGVLDIEDPLLSPEDALISRLQARSMLLILDNCEQVIDAIAAIAQRTTTETESVTVLATSRLPLRIRGEHEVRIEPLPTPQPSDDPAANPAVQLFNEHARQVSSRFALNATTERPVVEICRLVDGLPLAIELAAAWVRVLDPGTLHARLAEGAPLLKSNLRDRPERHRTLTSTIDWSYQLLSPDARWAFGRLAVFQGGIPFDGATATLLDDDRVDFTAALGLLDTLVQANLLQAPTQTADGPRYAMLQTIQEFGLDTLSAIDHIRASRAHAEYFASMTASAAKHYRDAEAPIWTRRLDANIDNLRVAITWLASPENDTPVDAMETANHLSEFFELRNRNLENRRMLTAALETAPDQPSKHFARALARLGSTWLGHPEQAAEYYQRSIEVMARVPDPEPPFDGLVGLMALAQMQGDYAAAVSYARTFLHHARTTERPEMIANALLALGQLLSLNEQPDEALECWTESRTIAVQLGDEVGLAWIQRAEAEMRFWQGDHAQAEQLYLQAIATLEASGGRKLTAVCQLGMTKIAALHGDRAAALAYLSLAVDEISKGGFDLDTLQAVTTGALVCTLVLEDSATAIRLYSAADAWSQATGIRETPQSIALNNEIWQRAKSQVSTMPRSETSPLSLRAALELLQETLRAAAASSSETIILTVKI